MSTVLILARDQDDVESLATMIRLSDVVAVDTETTGLHPHAGDHITGMSVGYRTPVGVLEAWYVPINHPDSTNVDPTPIIEALNRHDAMQVFHHGPFDFQFLAPLGYQVPPAECLWDTKVVAWLMDENRRSTSLKDIGAELFGIDAKAEQTHLRKIMSGRTVDDCYRELRASDDVQWTGRGTAKAARIEAHRMAECSKKSWGDLTVDDIWEYGAKDAELTLMVFEWQQENISEDVLVGVEREMRVQRVLTRLMERGVRVDREAILTLRSVMSEAQADIENRYLDTNLNAPQQVAKLLYDELGLPCWHKTDAGGRSVARHVLEELEGQHPVVSDLLEHRRRGKMLSAYVEPLLRTVGLDGRVHASLSSSRTVTGRLSSSDPNLQTIPKEETNAEVRACFIPAPGMELWEYDLQQAELRVMAGYANETNMMSALEEGRDLHGETAESIFGPNYTELQRRLAKNLNFGFAYGIGPAKFATYMVAGTGRPVTPKEVRDAERILDGYRETYPRLVALMDHLADYADQHKIMPLHVPGRYRRFKSPGVIVPGYTALNAIVQGGIAEFMKDMMIAVEESPTAGGMVLQVHDSLWFEVEPGWGEQVQRALQIMADRINPFAMRMVFDAKRLDS